MSSTKKPFRLKFVPEQVFTVAESPSGSGCGNGFGSGPGEQYCYVWLYEPPPGLFNWLAGAGLLIGIILCCLFPLWPPQLRLLAYYLLLVASGLLGLILLIALVRAVVFAFVYLATLGRRRFWLLPNFFADCGFKDSFKPAWSCTIINPNNNLSSSTDASGSSTDKSPQFLTDEIGTGCQEIQYPSDKKTD
ncbi:unnamed protein product [Protopolystoma xenopodis]|uniref:Translocation protein SEC62 n=1 Tax=Protopolystoma xenopodis TaxID=117903 RepID=A0A3S5AKM2_9PLAT|nr:unnamed protein product [Protopolystoma xenopodis]